MQCPNIHKGLANPLHMPVLVLFALTRIARFYRKKQASGLEILISTPEGPLSGNCISCIFGEESLMKQELFDE